MQAVVKTCMSSGWHLTLGGSAATGTFQKLSGSRSRHRIKGSRETEWRGGVLSLIHTDLGVLGALPIRRNYINLVHFQCQNLATQVTEFSWIASNWARKLIRHYTSRTVYGVRRLKKWYGCGRACRIGVGTSGDTVAGGHVPLNVPSSDSWFEQRTKKCIAQQIVDVTFSVNVWLFTTVSSRYWRCCTVVPMVGFICKRWFEELITITTKKLRDIRWPALAKDESAVHHHHKQF